MEDIIQGIANMVMNCIFVSFDTFEEMVTKGIQSAMFARAWSVRKGLQEQWKAEFTLEE